MSNVGPKEIREYLTAAGRSPFGEWLSSLQDVQGRAKVRVRLDRLRLGNLGDSKPVGPGYRVYLAQVGKNLILLLCGGDKSTQAKDIQAAHEYWADYRRRKRSNERS